jgi:Dockerin type I domain
MFTTRAVVTCALFSAAALLGMFSFLSFAANPSSGTLSPGTPLLTYDAGPLPPNPIQDVTGLALSGPVCQGTGTPGATCDSYALTVTLPQGYHAANPAAEVQVTLFWTNTDPTNNAASDYDLYVYKGVVGDLNGTSKADWQSTGDSTADPEIAHVTPLQDGTNQFTIKVVAFQPAGETVHVKIELLSHTGGAGGFPGFGQADPVAPGVPRFQIFSNTTADGGQNNGQGEFNIGYNNITRRIMAYNGLEADVYRVTPPEVADPSAPECCLETWVQKAPGLTGGFAFGLDPILWTDNWTESNPLPMQPTAGARTFVANSTAGTNASYAVTDNDGDSYLATNASAPNASSDHETIGSGPYPAAMSLLKNPVNHGHAVYYCAQTYPVGAAACQRSDNFGNTYGPSTLMYTGNAGSLCGGIHGHVHVGPDGTVYVPVRDCTGNAGVAVSMDAGTNWTTYSLPNTPVQVHGSDPSIAIDADNKVYIFYIVSNADHSEGHVHVQVSTDHGATWSKDTDLGISHGVLNSAFPEAIGGSSGRAACGFVGSDRAGDYENINYPGYWYLFMATTYDGGDSWTVTNVTPNDPVQGKGGIWQGGGSGITNRNLLDFNEVTMDEKGRILFGYSDGCTGDCVGNPDNNTFRAAMRVARQSGGKPLLAAFDPNPAEPSVPKPPCLSGSRDASGVHLTWRAPDNGGADIVSYAIYRSSSTGTETFLVATGNTKLNFTDITADPAQPVYYKVRAINSVDPVGGTLSNEVNLPATPGIQLLGISSVKTHGGTDYGINLPLNGSGIECRSGGGTGDYAVVFDFANAVSSVTSATVSSGTGSVSGTAMQNGNYVVNLTGVTSGQKLTITLSGVKDSANNTLSSLNAVMGVLIGDTTGDGAVNSADISQTKSRSGQPVSATNFRSDVTVDGSLNSADISLVKSKSGTALP